IPATRMAPMSFFTAPLLPKTTIPSCRPQRRLTWISVGWLPWPALTTAFTGRVQCSVPSGCMMSAMCTVGRRYVWGWITAGRAATDYYYGVDTHEVAGEVDFTYKPGSALTPYMRFDWQRQLSKNWTLQATLHHKWLDSAITDSPIVDGSSSTSVFVGGVYHF